MMHVDQAWREQLPVPLDHAPGLWQRLAGFEYRDDASILDDHAVTWEGRPVAGVENGRVADHEVRRRTGRTILSRSPTAGRDRGNADGDRDKSPDDHGPTPTAVPSPNSISRISEAS
jgi:hypothetical protein